MESPPSVLIISLSDIAKDLRVMRQIRAVKRAGYRVTIAGFTGAIPVPPDLQDVPFVEVPGHSKSRARKLFIGGLLTLSHMVPPLADAAFWIRPWMRKARAPLAALPPADVIIGNDLEGLALASFVADRNPGAKIIFDAHEYFIHLTTGIHESLSSVMRRRVLSRHVHRAAFMTTVCDPLAAMYEQNLGRPCGVVYNASSYAAEKVAPPEPWDGKRPLRLVHHGMIARDRGQENLVLAMAHAPGCELHFHLVAPPCPEYANLQKLAAEHAPGRVFFHEPVKPAEIPAMLRNYDLGMCVIAPTCANTLNMLPNKFFECLYTGLGVVIGPSPAMRPIAERYGCGAVADSFDPKAVGAMIAAITPEKVSALQEGARRAATEINFESESRKVMELVNKCLEPDQK